ncbi:hypothetical protein SK128_021397 [Halocaridina rubra]|uniref:Titin n=1 Tax=Halocaridina rubra TaxID=373956 RepID=A0AAN8XHF7_HALRR
MCNLFFYLRLLDSHSFLYIISLTAPVPKPSMAKAQVEEDKPKYTVETTQVQPAIPIKLSKEQVKQETLPEKIIETLLTAPVPKPSLAKTQVEENKPIYTAAETQVQPEVRLKLQKEEYKEEIIPEQLPETLKTAPVPKPSLAKTQVEEDKPKYTAAKTQVQPEVLLKLQKEEYKEEIISEQLPETLKTAPVPTPSLADVQVEEKSKYTAEKKQVKTETSLKLQKEQPRQETVPEQLVESLQLAPVPTPSLAETQVEEDRPKYTAEKTQVRSEMCVPGFKALVNLATEGQIDLETVELHPAEKVKFEKDIGKLSFHLKRGVQVNELMSMMKEGEFVALKKTEDQAQLLDVVSRLERATVHKVLVQEASDRKERSIGLKSVLRTIETGQESMEQVIMDISREFGPSSEPVKEIAAIGHLLQEGVKCEEVVVLSDSGLLPSLKTPQVQAPLVSMVADKGHVGSICEVLVEESAIAMQDKKPKLKAARMTEMKDLLKKAKAETVNVKTFTPEMVPGVKAYVRMAQEEKVNIEEVVEKSSLEPKLKEEVAKIGMMVKHGVMAQDVITLMEAGEFPQLMKLEAQAQLMEVVEEFGFKAFVNEVMTEQVEQAIQKTDKTIGVKAFMRMLQKADVNVEELITEQFPKELDASVKEPVAQEMAKVSVMLKEGVQAEEIMSMVETGQLPSLQQPETQMPLVNVVKEQGHSALVCQVLIEDSVRDIVQELPKVDKATISSVESLQSASTTQIEVRAFELAPPLDVKPGDQLRAVATYVAESTQENAMHLVEGERIYIQESTNSDWWFVKKHLTLEQGYVPAKLLADEVSYTHYVQQKLQEKIMKLPVFEKLKKGQKPEAPKVTQLQPIHVQDGQEAQFVCKIQGTPRPNVTWFRQTAIIKPSDEFQVFYSDDNTATLVIKEVFPEDAGMFTCVAKNETGYSFTSAELVVEGPVSDHGSSVGASRRSLSRESSLCDIMEGIPPTFANKSTVKTVEEGAQLEMDVRLVAIPEPEIIWKKDGQVLKESQRVRIVRQKDVHAYRSIFIVKNAKKEDEGKYEIWVKNREGEAKNYITLRVTAPQAPSFDEKFGDQTVDDGGTIRLVARIHGVPAPDVTWSSTFKRGLESCIVEENSEVVLECRTSKEKQCKWYKGKTELKPSKNMTIEQEGLTHRLIIHTSTCSDSGKYKCTFENQSTFCNLTVKGLDDFVERVQDVEVQELEEAVLQVEVSSDKVPVSWHKDGEELTDSDRIKLVSEGKIRKLILKKATLSDEGEYTCVLGDQECTAELTVRELPAEIVRKMKDQVVSKGQRASMEVELTKGDAVITWFKDNKEIRFSDHYQLSIDGKIQRLLVYNCQAEDAGTYRAVVAKSECSAQLRVELQAEGDFLTRLPSQMDVNFQSDATLTVEITKDFDVRWFRNQEEIKADEKYIIKKEVRKRILIVKNVSQADSAEYSCVLANLKTTCKVNVVLMMMSPKIPKENQKQEVVVTKGKDATLKVPFTATPKPKAFWYFKGQLLDTEGNKQKLLSTITETEASITVKMVESVDCGEYRLKLCNDCGAAYADYTLKILDKPSKPGAPEIMKVANDSVTLHWTAPKEDGGREITNYIVEYMLEKEKSWFIFNKEQKIRETTVVVTKLTKDEEYCFRVSAENEVGKSDVSDTSKAVKVCEPTTAEPPVVKEQLQAVVTGLNQEVVLRCVVTATPLPKIEWMKDGKAIKGETRYENFTATFTIKQTREDSGGNYLCRASNEAGMAECSATVVIQESPRFEFDENKQCQTLTVGDQWQVPIQVIGYPRPKITWARNDKPLVSTPHINIQIKEAEGMTTITIQKLALEDTAVYTLTAENSAGKAQLSFNLRVLDEAKELDLCALEVIQEEVKRERPSAPQGPLTVTEVTSSSVTLNWRAPAHDGGMPITSYYIEKLEKTQKHWQKVADVNADCRTYTVTELTEGSEYFFRVFALNAVGVSEALEVSQTILIKSAFDKPGPPIGPFDVSNMTESSLVLHWDEPESDGGSPITHYLLEKRESTKKAWSKVDQTPASTTEIEVTGLKKGTAYYFRVFAFNAVGQGLPLQPEEPITAGKKITPPSKPNSLQVIDVTTKTVTLAWAPPSTTGGADLMGYVIERRLTTEKKWEKVDTVDASVTLYCIENLKEKSEYEFRVFAENPVGLSLEPAVTEQVRLKTHAMPPSPPTAPLEVRPTGPTSLMIEWGAPESDGGAPLQGYIIAIRDIKRTMWIEVGQVGANFTRLHIKELQEEHEYFVRVFARNEVGSSDPLEIDEPVKIIRPADFTELPEDDNAPSLSYSTTETLSWMREAGMDADIYSYARGRLLNRDEYFFKVWHRGVDKPEEKK